MSMETSRVVEARCTSSDIYVGVDRDNRYVLLALTAPGSDQVETLKAMDLDKAENIARQMLEVIAMLRAQKS